MEDFEQRNTYENIRDEIIAVPPKRDAGHEQSNLHGIGSLPYDPQSSKMQKKEDRNRDGREKEQLLAVLND